MLADLRGVTLCGEVGDKRLISMKLVRGGYIEVQNSKTQKQKTKESR